MDDPGEHSGFRVICPGEESHPMRGEEFPGDAFGFVCWLVTVIG